MRLTLLTSIVALPVLAVASPQPQRRATGMAIPITKRSSSVDVGQSVNFEEINSELASLKEKVLRGFENFEKNTGAPHPAALKGTQKRATGSDPMVNSLGRTWYGNISVGTPGVVFQLNFDTSMSDLLIPGSYCTESCINPGGYNLSHSSTSQDMNRSFNLTEDGVLVNGDLVSDSVTVAGLTAKSQTIAVANISESALKSPVQGVMGMAFPSMSAYNATPVFQTLISQGQVSEPVFSFKLGPTGDSEMFLGGVNEDLFVGDFTYTPVTKEGYWEVNMDGVEGNGESILKNIDCIIATGYDRITGTTSEVAALHRALGGTDIGGGYYTYLCTAFPSISFTFGGTSFPISADALNIGFKLPGSDDCVSGIIGLDGVARWIVGDTFLQNVYSTFDVGNKRVGFAELAPTEYVHPHP